MKRLESLLIASLIGLVSMMIVIQGGNALARATGWKQPQPAPTPPVPSYRTA
jgi:hypothetical protein